MASHERKVQDAAAAVLLYTAVAPNAFPTPYVIPMESIPPMNTLMLPLMTPAPPSAEATAPNSKHPTAVAHTTIGTLRSSSMMK